MPELGKVLKQALGLDVRERATLAERMLASLEDLPAEEVEALWAEEALRRRREYRAGRAIAIPAKEVHRRAREIHR